MLWLAEWEERMLGIGVLSQEERVRARRLFQQGWTLRQIGAELGCSHMTVSRQLAPRRRPKDHHQWEPGGNRLRLEEREEIALGVARGETFSAIAGRLGRSTSTVSREVAAGGGPKRYRAVGAHKRAFENARRPKSTRLADPRLALVVSGWLMEFYSPVAISRRLRLEFPDDPMMRVSHETIYETLFVQGRGELRRELTRCLRSGRTQRRPRGRAETRGRIPGKVMISERPAEVEDRSVPGHWEGDLIIGKNSRSAVGTLVERTSRYTMLLHLPDGHDAEKVDAAMRLAVKKLPQQFFRTITWDQGMEMARHAAFSIDTGVQIYFCDPHSPWQRPTNENTNGLLRQYMPKGTDLSTLTEADLDRIAKSINNRPRGVLNYLKPTEVLSALLAHTT